MEQIKILLYIILLRQHNINIRELKLQSHDGIFEGYISLYVTNTEDLAGVINRIKQIKGIERVTRRENIVENG